RSSFTFAKFQRSIAAETWRSRDSICPMICCASACLPATVPGSAVAALTVPRATAIAQRNAGMWRIFERITNLSVGGKMARSGRGASQGQEGNSLSGRPQGTNKPKSTAICASGTRTNGPISGFLWYGAAFVRGPARIQARMLAVGAIAVISGALATAGGAETPTTLQQRADALRRANSSLADRSHEALLGL